MLDDSGSMEGAPWEAAKKGSYEFMKAIDRHPDHKLSIVIFNSHARIVVGEEKPE